MSWKLGGKRTSGAGSQKTGGGCLIVFGLFFGGMGLMFFVFIFRQFLAEAETYRWEEVPCEIVRCEIAADSGRDDPFQLETSYRYRFQGNRLTSDRYSLQPKKSGEYEKLALLRKDLLENPAPICFVNPDAPSEAVLRRSAVSAGLFSFFPLIFVAIGGGIVWFGIASLRKEKAEKRSTGTQSISAAGNRSKKGSWMAGAIVGAVFAAIGLAILIPVGLGPIQRMLSSRGWVETPCKVIWSRVQSHDSDDGTTYSVDIFYEYEFAGQTHRSNRYEAMGGSSSGYEGKREIVNRYPAGTQQVCYVNPDVPEQAMLRPGVSAWALIGLLPLVFFALGLFILMASLKARKKSHYGIDREMVRALEPSDGVTDFQRRDDEGSEGPVVLKPHASRWVKLGGILFFTLLWNGIVSVFVVQVVKGWQAGRGEIFLTLFMIPFVLVGIGVLAAFLYQLLAMRNPHPVLTLSTGLPRLGETVNLSWRVSGRVSRIVSFRISLWGIETATYRRGTNTVTSSEVFLEQEIFETASMVDIESGSAVIEIPGDLMYSLKLGNNEIKYELRVKGDIPLWPDIGDSFELTLLPRRPDPV
ncbi:MAG: DUF3592 domain-containing protein [Verrucomicrobiae bacterium]|nr:DUF3592 domain-containing protein [Verrucomicrobiae bacterium]